MLEVTRLNGTAYYVNPDMIMYVEATPDTVITLTSGDKLLIKETPEQLRNNFIAFKKKIYLDGFDVKDA